MWGWKEGLVWLFQWNSDITYLYGVFILKYEQNELMNHPKGWMGSVHCFGKQTNEPVHFLKLSNFK